MLKTLSPIHQALSDAINPEWIDLLSGEELDAIKFYKGTGGTILNEILEGLRPHDDYYNKFIFPLRTALKKCCLAKPITVYRGESVNSHKTALARIDQSSRPAFLSTSLSLAVAKFYARAPNHGIGLIFEFRLPVGVNAAYIHPIPLALKDEGEVLLPENTKYDINSVTERNSMFVVKAKVLK